MPRTAAPTPARSPGIGLGLGSIRASRSTRQRDGISDNGQEVWNFLKQKKIKHVIIMGVHTNMCVLNRPFAIKAMVRRGMDVILGA